MHPSRNNLIAILMVCVTSIGLLLSIFFTFQIWRNRLPATGLVQSGIDQASTVLVTTGDGLEIIDQVISNVVSTTLYLDQTASAISQTIQSTGAFMDSAGSFIGQDLINTITNTQSALQSAQASAGVIDNILSTLANVPLIGIKYNPAVPLNTALGNVSASLDPLQGTLSHFEKNLRATSSDMQVFKDQVVLLDANILAIKENLAESQRVIDNYRSLLARSLTWMDKARASTRVWVNTLCWVITLIILWLVMIQVAILLQGINHLKIEPIYPDRARSDPTVEIDKQ